MSLSESGSGNLPAQLTRFFGRGSETAELEGVVRSARLVTLTGAPGCGKSRLGIEVGRRVASRFADGVRLVELTGAVDRDCVAGAVAFVLDVGERPGRPLADALVRALADREALVILDNCEHVVAGVAELAARLVAGCPSLRVLATSRLPLGVPGEQVWAVPPLDLATATDLFVDRARLVSSDFQIDDGDEQVRRVCDRVDGLPLAIELAAAWVRVLSPAQLADRLDDALALLTAAPRSRAPRQATMEATVECSYRLLAPDEQRLFAQLSVFNGGFGLAGAEAIADGDGGALSRLTALVDHSLVQVESGADGSMRYRILEPVRQHAAAVLDAGGDGEVARRRHAEHILELARHCDADLRNGGRRVVALRRLEQEEGNLIAALEWARTQPSDLGLQFCVALARFWALRGPIGYARAYMEQMLAAGTDDRRLRVAVLSRAAKLAWRHADCGRARVLLEESLTIARQLDEPLPVARRLRSLSLVAILEGDIDAAIELCQQSLATFRGEEDELGVALTLIHLGWAWYLGGDPEAGDAQMQEALSLARTVANGPATTLSLLGLSYGAQLAGDIAAVRRYFVEAVTSVRSEGVVGSEANWAWAGAVLAADEGRHDAALRLVGGAEAFTRRRGVDLESRFRAPLQARIDQSFRERAATADRLLAEGARMSLDDLIAEAVAEPGADDSRGSGESLSDREREVAGLVGQGMTNTEIAARLFISKRTVESHVDHIKQKLGHGSRSQVIAWALQEILDPVH